MREIKFRAWDKIKKEWTTAHYLTINPNGQIYGFDQFNITKNYDISFYIGLKDKNGKEIYEGDVVNAHRFIECVGGNLGIYEGEEEDKRKVEYVDFLAGFILIKQDNYLRFEDCSDEGIEIIGNIYENPELLKGHGIEI